MSFREDLINSNLIQRSWPRETGVYEIRRDSTGVTSAKEARRQASLASSSTVPEAALLH